MSDILLGNDYQIFIFNIEKVNPSLNPLKCYYSRYIYEVIYKQAKARRAVFQYCPHQA